MRLFVLFVARVEIVTGSGGRCGHIVRARAMRPPAPARIAFAATTALKTCLAAIDLRLRPGDERRQAIDAASVRDHRLGLRRLRLILRLRAMLAIPVMFARLLIALIGRLPLALIVIALIVVAHERLRLLRSEPRLLAEMRKTLAVVVAAAVLGRNLGVAAVGARLRLALAELSWAAAIRRK